MARVQTNTVALLYAAESTHGTRAANYGATDNSYTQAEPNEISTFAADISTTAREPISNRLQRQKGAITDLAATVEFGADTTMAAMLEWLPAVVFGDWQNKDVRGTDGTGIDPSAVTATAFTVPAFGADATGARNYLKFPASGLIWCDGFANTANNGLRSVTTAAAATGTAITSAAVGGNNGNAQAALSTEASAPDDARVNMAGYRIAGAGSTTNWTYASATGRGTLTATETMVTAMKVALKKGQWVHLGSVKTRGGSSQNDVAGKSGFARYTGDGTTTTLLFDRVSEDIQVSSTNFASGSYLDVLYGDFLKNVTTTDDNYLDRAYTMALVSENLLDTSDGVEYALGSKIGPLAISFALNDKSTFTASFVSRDVEKAIAPGGANTDTKKEFKNAAYSTVADFARLRMDVDANGIDSDFKSLTLTLDPQISPENVIGQLGARYVNRGNLNVTAEAEVIFASSVIPNAIRDNATASFDCAISNDDGVLIFDVPSMTIGGGGRSYPANASVTITGTGEAFEDTAHASSIMISQFFVPLPTE